MRNLASISKGRGVVEAPELCVAFFFRRQKSPYPRPLINKTWSTGGADHLLCYSHTFATRRTTQGRATRLIRWPVRLFGSLFFPTQILARAFVDHAEILGQRL
ncbi:hypothetical protein NC651_009471 [Populus alba x Populus x berolinensis]|jgi:hypothetical protein|nr:hypothetical protein NC651_009471 [Populus alba x Populus x berolinensis]